MDNRNIHAKNQNKLEAECFWTATKCLVGGVAAKLFINKTKSHTQRGKNGI